MFLLNIGANNEQDFPFFLLFVDVSKKLAASTMANKCVVPVFSASKAVQQAAGPRVTYEQLEIETCEAHGSFDKATGVFTVKTAGNYLIQFNETAVVNGNVWCRAYLRVNDIIKAKSFITPNSGRNRGSCTITSVLKLNSGDKVDVVIENGWFWESPDSDGAYNYFSVFILPY